MLLAHRTIKKSEIDFNDKIIAVLDAKIASFGIFVSKKWIYQQQKID